MGNSDDRLPESVEAAIRTICHQKDQPPLKTYARKMLAKIGERPALDLLRTVLSAPAIKSFGGFVARLVKERYPAHHESALSECGYSSPQASPHPQNMRSPSSYSPRSLNGETVQSPMSSSPVNSTSSCLHRTNPQNGVSFQLCFENGTQEKRTTNVRGQSSHNSEYRKMTEPTTISLQLMILSKLEYRKFFLILSYIGSKRLEDVVNIDDAKVLLEMKDLPMIDFETHIWNIYGQIHYNEGNRCRYNDWDSGKTHLYYCHVLEDGHYHFKGPYLNSATTHLQRSLGDDNVLIVKFSEDGEYDIDNIVESGILVGLRRFRFFVFKDERNKKGKRKLVEEEKVACNVIGCYFVYTDSVSPCAYDEHYILYKKSISEARSLFMHVHTLSSVEKYMARFSLILSKTRTLELDFAAVIIERIEDIPLKDDDGNIIYDKDGKPILHTDGTGYISKDLAMKCPKHFTRAKSVTDKDEECNEYVELEDRTCQRVETKSKDPPLLMQCRLFYDGYAVKGTLLINRKLEPGTIQIRRSMIKVERDLTLPIKETSTFNALEIVNISGRPGRNCLSKNLIALLSYGGVPREFFLNLLTDALEETRNVYSDKRAALRVATNNDGLDYGFVAERMISCGVPLNEPYLQHCLWKLEGQEKTKLKEGKIPIDESFYLMGTADPAGVLENDQVCVILDNGQISGKVLVYRNPGLHFGDVHIMEAVYVKKLEDYVGNAKYGIFFSTKGCRSAAYEIATGDFDGDLYWVSRNPALLKHYKASPPWSRTHLTSSSVSRSPQANLKLEHQLFQLFLDARKSSFSMAIASESWCSFMDRLLTLSDKCSSEKQALKEKMSKLVDIYYEALDAPKSGKKVKVHDDLKANYYPHYMGKMASYKSASVLGQIYDRVMAFKDEAVRGTDVWKLPCFDTPIPELYDAWIEQYEDYRKEMAHAMKSTDELKNKACSNVIKKYKQLLFDAPELEESTKSSDMIYEEAVAIYHVTYDYAKSYGVEKCGFAWKVAGSALCNLCAWKLAGPKEKPIAILPSVLRDLLHK